MDIKLKWGSKEIGQVQYNGTVIDNRKYKTPLEIDFMKWPEVNNEIRCCYSYNIVLQQFKASSYDGEKEVKKIAFVVESPHKSEFTCCFKPIRPLNGASGECFDAVISQKMKTWFPNIQSENILYEIKIFNPVKYQASLHHYLNNQIPQNKLPNGIYITYSFDKELKNTVWKSLFENNITKCKENFVNEIIDYEPDYIVNSCTGSCTTASKEDWIKFVNVKYKGGQSLKALAKGALINANNNLLQKAEYREDTHPASW